MAHSSFHTGDAASTAVLQALHRLVDYPLLASLAKARTTASRLDGRACLHLYTEGLKGGWPEGVSAVERAFMESLGVPCP